MLRAWVLRLLLGRGAPAGGGIHQHGHGPHVAQQVVGADRHVHRDLFLGRGELGGCGIGCCGGARGGRDQNDLPSAKRLVQRLQPPVVAQGEGLGGGDLLAHAGQSRERLPVHDAVDLGPEAALQLLDRVLGLARERPVQVSVVETQQGQVGLQLFHVVTVQRPLLLQEQRPVSQGVLRIVERRLGVRPHHTVHDEALALLETPHRPVHVTVEDRRIAGGVGRQLGVLRAGAQQPFPEPQDPSVGHAVAKRCSCGGLRHVGLPAVGRPARAGFWSGVNDVRENPGPRTGGALTRAGGLTRRG